MEMRGGGGNVEMCGGGGNVEMCGGGGNVEICGEGGNVETCGGGGNVETCGGGDNNRNANLDTRNCMALRLKRRDQESKRGQPGPCARATMKRWRE
jgi:hypothetical protein